MKKIGAFVVLIVLLVAGVYLWQKTFDPAEIKKEEAIRQAQEYNPTGVCSASMVPAIHKATGAKYTFNSGCLAPGWEPDLAAIKF